MKVSISVAIAIAFGIIVLLGYFLNISLLSMMSDVFLQYAAVLAAVALLVGLVNLFTVHWRKAAKGEKGAVYSVVVLISFGITILVVAFFGPTAPWSMWIFNNIQIPIESSLMALLVVILIFASIRLFRKRMNWFTWVFMGTALVMLLGSAPLFGVEVPLLHGPYGLRSLLAQIPVAAGARGLLLGVALGTIATGLRILIGSDRPYGG
jgi:hypothetical protein